jgi:hypothetical protein
MTKKQIRIILASTVFVPWWIFTGCAVCIFPIWIMGLFAALGQTIELLVRDMDESEKYWCKQEIKDSLIMGILPITIMVLSISNFVKTGRLFIE